MWIRRLGLSSWAFGAVALGWSMFAVPSSAADSCSSCPGDVDGDNRVTIDELVLGVNSALKGCAPAPPEKSRVLQTGQTQCDQGSGTLGPCPGFPPGQDADIGAGVLLSYVDNGDGTISDTATSLTWEKLSDDGGIHDWENAYTWYEAYTVKIAALNTEPCFAGHCDWRLPNRRELESLVVAGRVGPAIDPVFDEECAPGCAVSECSCTQLDFYWSSTTFRDLPEFAWNVDANLGILNGFEKGLPFFVRAVRGGL